MLWLWIDDRDVLDAITGDRRREDRDGNQGDEDEPGDDHDHDPEQARRDEG